MLNQGITREQRSIISHQLLIPISSCNKDVDVVSKDTTNFYIFIFSIVTLNEHTLTTFLNQLLNFLHFCVLYKKKKKLGQKHIVNLLKAKTKKRPRIMNLIMH
jgi:hypothetical protein